MDILIQVSQFILSLSLLIVLHELGHFIPAKLFKTKVEKFYLFFDPYFSLFKKKIGETEYGVGWLPLGGYVKISGMIDESMDKEQMAKPPQPWEFRSKPAWQRLIIMIGGVTVNVLLAILIYAGMMMFYGEEYLPNENVVYGITTDSTAQSLGLRNGDKIISIGETKIERFSEIPKEILLTSAGNIELDRAGKRVKLELNENQKSSIIKSRSPLVGVRVPYVAADFTDTSAAKLAGLEAGDSIVGLNHKPLNYFDQYIDSIPKYAGKTISLHVFRAGKRLNFDVDVPESGKIGIYGKAPDNFLSFEFHKYGFFEAFPVGIIKAKDQLVDYVRQFKLITNPETGAYKEVGGFIMIAKQFDTFWNWQKFWAFTAFLSIMLAFLNILPIPALDGGHVVFVLWEMITGRKPSQKVLEYAQVVGFIILLALIVLANGNDILRLFK
jgi:regulator of sigma E protease